jgi:peptidoglycan/LPS O-acetylase OafA/YrhL
MIGRGHIDVSSVSGYSAGPYLIVAGLFLVMSHACPIGAGIAGFVTAACAVWAILLAATLEKGDVSSTTAPRKLRWSSSQILTRFRRITTSGRFISEIDGLRFIAIGTVVLFHIAVNLNIKSPVEFAIPQSGNIIAAIARPGFHGVELFFVISGFILAHPFASHYLKRKPPVNLKQYFLRRVTRLEPPYFFCLIIFFVVLVTATARSASDLYPHLLASLGYLHNVIYGEESAINNVAWSLEIEIQFYLLVPLLAKIFAITRTVHRRALIIAVCILIILFQLLFITPGGRLSLSILNFLQFFLVGFLLADVYLTEWNEAPTSRWSWDLVSLVGWPALFYLWNSPELSRAITSFGTSPILPAVLFPIGTFFLYSAVFRGPLTNRIMTNQWITTIGGMCYTIYLFHNKLIGLIIGFTKGVVVGTSYTPNYLVQCLLVIPPMLVACALYFALIEKPCMRKDWPRRFMERVRSPLFKQREKVATPIPR